MPSTAKVKGREVRAMAAETRDLSVGSINVTPLSMNCCFKADKNLSGRSSVSKLENGTAVLVQRTGASMSNGQDDTGDPKTAWSRRRLSAEARTDNRKKIASL